MPRAKFFIHNYHKSLNHLVIDVPGLIMNILFVWAVFQRHDENDRLNEVVIITRLNDGGLATRLVPYYASSSFTTESQTNCRRATPFILLNAALFVWRENFLSSQMEVLGFM